MTEKNKNVLKRFIEDGQLPGVTIDIHLSRETILDLAAAAIAVAIVIALLNKFLLKKI